MKIGILGWGSLLWEGGPEFDQRHGQWEFDGPTLKLEFSRISKTRLGALTLVIDEERGASTTVAWCRSKRTSMDDAICDLRCREGTTVENIGRRLVSGGAEFVAPGAVGDPILVWAQSKGLDAVVWTALKSNFTREKMKSFTVEAAVSHIKELVPDAKAKAAEYVWRAPAFVKTPLRSRLEAEPWFTSKRKLVPGPCPDKIKCASEHVAWEYVMLLGSALEMTKPHDSPTRHFIQEAFLGHVRNLAEFFREGVAEFKKEQKPPERPRDNIYAVDFCHSVGWQPEAFGYDKNLIKAVNKTLSHMTYSRDPASMSHACFDGPTHLHGTVELMRRTWGEFLKVMDPRFLRPKCPKDIPYWLDKHTEGWLVGFSALVGEFEAAVNERVRESEADKRQGRIVDFPWMLNQTPDGPV